MSGLRIKERPDREEYTLLSKFQFGKRIVRETLFRTPSWRDEKKLLNWSFAEYIMKNFFSLTFRNFAFRISDFY